MFRLGHMGNIDQHTLVGVVAAIERTMIRMGQAVTPGAGLAALQAGLVEA
jgi:aspartate aminotransferase-like enzyme